MHYIGYIVSTLAGDLNEMENIFNSLFDAESVIILSLRFQVERVCFYTQFEGKNLSFIRF